jgi:YD repeat-containing protein
VNGKEHRFELEKRPIVKNESGMNVVEQLQPSLASWTWPDGKWESYEFAVTPEVVPTLKVTNAEKVATTYTWDPKNGHILSDGEWTYQIGEVSKPYDLPRIERTNAKGEKEFTYTDQKAGITDRQTLEDGHRVTQVFSSPGNLYGKVRKIEQVDPKGNKTPVLQLSYDEQGRLYRKIDDSGFATIYKYKKDGRLESKVHVSSQNSKELDVEKNNLISAVMNSRTNVERGDATEALALFYIYKLHNFSEAQKLLPLMNNKKQIFNLKWRLIAESSKSSVDKIREINALAKEYPEKQRLLGIITDNITN